MMEGSIKNMILKSLKKRREAAHCQSIHISEPHLPSRVLYSAGCWLWYSKEEGHLLTNDL